MNYDEMTISELKDHAKELGIAVGNCGKEKLIEKIKEKERTDHSEDVKKFGFDSVTEAGKLLEYYERIGNREWIK